MPFGCPCQPTDILCDICREERFGNFQGVAQCRGEVWARAIAEVVPVNRRWPRTKRMRAIALRKVSDLTRDAELRERLADEVVKGAARWWDAECQRLIS